MISYRVSNIPIQLEEQDLSGLLGKSALIDVFAPAANTTDSETKKVAVVRLECDSEFANQKSIFLPEPLLAKTGLKRGVLHIDTDFLGLTPLNVPTKPVVMDVVAVTGLGGHAFGSWKAKGGEFMWLRDALPVDITDLRILTYGFDSGLVGSTSFASITSYATELFQRLSGARDHVDARQRPLVFICHSFGGLIVKQTLVTAATTRKPGTDEVLESADQILKSTAALLLYGVPNRGLRIESLLPMVRGQPNHSLVEALKPESTYLELLHHNFCTHFTFPDSEIISFWETKLSPTALKQEDGTWKMNGPMEVLVSRSSATGSRPSEPMYNDAPINATHSEMVKFEGPTDNNYTFVRDKLKQFRAEAPAKIFQRFSPSRFVTDAESSLCIKNGWTQLHLASHKGYIPMVKKLLTEGADTEAAASNGATALHQAALAGHEAIVRVLLDNKAKVDATNYFGFTALYSACSAGHEAVVKLLLEREAKMIPVNDGGFTPLHCAASQGRELVVRALLDQKPEIMDIKSDNHYTPLHSAATNGYYPVVQLLLDRGAFIEATSKDLQTPLHLACIKGSEEVVKELISRGAKIEARTTDGKTPLFLASESGHRGVMEILFSRGADGNTSSSNGSTPLHRASSTGDVPIVKLLLHRSAKVDPLATDGTTPLHSASLAGREAVVGLLLDHGADIKAKYSAGSYGGMTALHAAAQNNREAVVCLLLERGADIEEISIDNSTALHFAIREGKDRMVSLLLQKGANIEAKCDAHFHKEISGEDMISAKRFAILTALHSAALSGNLSICKILLDHGANIETEMDGATPLTSASTLGLTGVVELLLDFGANIEAKGPWRKTPLIRAADAGRDESVRILLDRGADIEAKTTSTWTALFQASWRGYAKVVRVLLENGANIEVTDRLWRSPLSMAKRRGHLETVKVLEEYGAKSGSWWPKLSQGPATAGKPTASASSPGYSARQMEINGKKSSDVVTAPISDIEMGTGSSYSLDGTIVTDGPFTPQATTPQPQVTSREDQGKKQAEGFKLGPSTRESSALTAFESYKKETEFHDGYVVHHDRSSERVFKSTTWDIEHEIGRGGAGTVYCQRKRGTNTLRAVKAIQTPKGNLSPELEVLVELREYDKFFVRFLGWYLDTSSTFMFIITEYIREGDLSSYIGNGSIFARMNAKEITIQILNGLQILHNKNIYHRDIKPQNILIARRDPIWVKIADFGVSRKAYNTTMKSNWGTESYRPPELRGIITRKRGQPRFPHYALDIWSLGVLVYELLAGHTPFAMNDDVTINGAAEPDSGYSESNKECEIDLDSFFQYCKGEIGLPIFNPRDCEVNQDAIDLVQNLLTPSPGNRPTAEMALDAISSTKDNWVSSSRLAEEPYLEDSITRRSSTDSNLYFSADDEFNDAGLY